MKKANSVKIIVTEDSAVYRKSVENALAEAHYELHWAKNGAEATELFLQHRPPVVITDWEMPDLSGIELWPEFASSNSGTLTSFFSPAIQKKNRLFRA
jgi:DNA-binding response OmpR family regulator